jgi:Mn-dependent DtxR family transcriptional regulator
VENADEKIWQYLTEHKTPVLASTLAKRFVVSKSHVSRILKDLEAKQAVDVIVIGSNKFYKAKESR